MFKRFKMFVLERKIRLYGKLYERCKYKALRCQYYEKQAKGYTEKLNNVETEYKELIGKEEEA